MPIPSHATKLNLDSMQKPQMASDEGLPDAGGTARQSASHLSVVRNIVCRGVWQLPLAIPHWPRGPMARRLTTTSSSSPRRAYKSGDRGFEPHRGQNTFFERAEEAARKSPRDPRPAIPPIALQMRPVHSPTPSEHATPLAAPQDS